MNIEEYYSILGLKAGASIADIKKAYRIKAMRYHPDRNQSPEAAEMFVRISEAYQYLLNHSRTVRVTEEEREKAYAAWTDYRREKAKQEAEKFAKASFDEFKKSELFKSTQSIDGRMLVFGFALSTIIIIYSIYGYSYRVANATCERDMPSLSIMLITVLLGIGFLFITILYFIAWKADKKKEKDGKADQSQASL